MMKETKAVEKMNNNKLDTVAIYVNVDFSVKSASFLFYLQPPLLWRPTLLMALPTEREIQK